MTGLRAAIVTNIPAPYRVPVLSRLAAMPDLDLHVYFCSGREPDRAWTLPELAFEHVFLKPRFVTWRDRYIHFNPDLRSALSRQAPEVIVTTGFNPTHLLGWWLAQRRGVAHVAMTDGTLASEQALGPVHRAVRRAVYRGSRAFVGASDGSFALYRSYGIDSTSLFKSQLCADNDRFPAARGIEPDCDLIFCGRFAAGKLPLFAIDVAARASRRLRRPLRLLMVGAGPLEAAARQAAAAVRSDVDCVFAGFASQDELPQRYSRARLMLFPTRGDTWGVVANEACAAGLPVITSPEAGVAGELVRDGENGRVLALDADAWAVAVAGILADEPMRRRLGARSRAIVAPYTYVNAASGLAAALRHAMRAA